MADNQEDMTPEQMAQLQRDNCIFCKLVSGDIPSKKVYEDDNFVGILDINPAIEGHVLLIPKQHFQILPQIPQDIVGNLGIACANVSGKIIKAFKCEGTSIFIANGAVAGQRAPHFMVHIMPRKDGDNISLNPKLADIDERLFNTVRERLLSSMKVSRPSSSSAPNKKEETAEQEAEEQPEEKGKDEETELEQEHRLKKERDIRQDKQKKETENEERNEDRDKRKKTNETNETKQKISNSKNKVDFDKLSRLLDK